MRRCTRRMIDTGRSDRTWNWAVPDFGMPTGMLCATVLYTAAGVAPLRCHMKRPTRSDGALPGRRLMVRETPRRMSQLRVRRLWITHSRPGFPRHTIRCHPISPSGSRHPRDPALHLRARLAYQCKPSRRTSRGATAPLSGSARIAPARRRTDALDGCSQLSLIHPLYKRDMRGRACE